MSSQPNGFRLLLALLSGALLATSSFPEINMPWFAWLAPGLILWASRGSTAKSVLSAGYFAGSGYCLISFYWLLLIPFPLYGVAAWLALSAGLSLYLAVWCGVCWYLFPKRKSPGKSKDKRIGLGETWEALTPWQRTAWSFLCAAAWVAMEIAVGRVLTDYPLFSLGFSQFRRLSLIQIAAVTGVYGVSFMVAWFSISLVGAAILLRGREKSFGPVLIQLFPSVLVIGCVAFYGMKTLSEPEKISGQLKIALIQPSFPERVIWNPNEETNRFLKLMDLSRAALAAKPKLLVWPEAALPEIIGRNRYTQETIGNLVRPANVWMVMGIVDVRPRPGTGKFDAFNSAFLVDPNGDLSGVYDKAHLLVFGEYMPWWARRLPFLAKLRKAAELTRGEHPGAFKLKGPHAKFPVSICYEDCFPNEIRRRVEPDTDFILNLTNDGWFGEAAAQWQHAVSALFRAVENGVPLVRCCNNGLTCWIDAQGRLHDAYFPGSNNIYQAGFKIVEVPLRDGDFGRPRTFYNRHGDWFGWGCGVVTLTAIAAVWFQRRKRKTEVQ